MPRREGLGALLLTAGALLGWGCHGALATSGPVDVATGDGGVYADAGESRDDAGGQNDAAVPPCSLVVAADYDQSCALDTDCVNVGQVSSCPAYACDGCATGAVNVDAAAAYGAALNKVLGGVGGGCGCACEGYAVCRAGKCEVGYCGPPMGDTLATCADAGGSCAYARSTSCTVGPADGCAYADEICCLN